MKWFNRPNRDNDPKIRPWRDNSEPVRPYGKDDYAAHNHLFLYSLIVLLVVVFLPVAWVQSAQVVFTQEDWYNQTSVMADTPPFTAWNAYYSADSGVLPAGNISLVQEFYNMTQLSDDGASDLCTAPGCVIPSGGFNAAGATFSQTAVEGSGSQARIALDTIAANGSSMNPFNINNPESISNVDNSAQPEQITAIAFTPFHMYTGGYDYSGTTGGQWRIEKRDIFSGLPVSGFGASGILGINQNGNDERINAMVIDNNFIYAAGYDTVTGPNDQRWRIEKRDMTTGAADGTFGGGSGVFSNPRVGDAPEQITAIAINATHIFAAGFDNANANNEQWRLEKRDINTGALTGLDGDGIITSDPDAGNGLERVTAIAIDANYIYLAGFDNVGGDTRWRIEKRDINTGALTGLDGDGIIFVDPSSGPDEIRAIAIDDTYMYLAGFDSNGNSGSEEWRIEKRRKDTGGYETNFNTTGFVLIDHPLITLAEKAQAIAIDKKYIFAGGYGYGVTASDVFWQIECLDIADGSPVTAFGNNGSLKQDYAGTEAKINALALDNRYLYAGGYSFSGGTEQWRLGKFLAKNYLPSGDYTSDVIDLGGSINNFNGFDWTPVAQAGAGTTGLTIDVRAGDNPAVDGTWTGWAANADITNGAALPGLQGKRYFQYRAHLTSTAPQESPYLNTVSLGFSGYPSAADLESSVFDTGDNSNFLTDIAWTETLNGQNVWVQVATSGNGSTWNYCGPLDANCNTNGTNWLTWDPGNYFDISTTNVPLTLKLADANNDRFFKYKVRLTSDGTDTPEMENIAITYDTAHLGLFDDTDGVTTSITPTANVPFAIRVKVLDSAGAVYNGHDHPVHIRLTASVPQPDLPGCTSSFTANNNTEVLATGLAFSNGELTISGLKVCEATSTGFTISAEEKFGGLLESTTDLTVTAVNVSSGSLVMNFKSGLTTNGITDQSLSPDPVVEIRDAFSNLDLSATNVVTLAAKKDNACTTDADGSLTADSLSVTAVGGVATFTNVKYDVAEAIYLYATATGGLTPICSSTSIDIASSGYVVHIEPVYDLTNDSIDIVTSFLRRGSSISGSISLSNLDILDETDTSIINGDLSTVVDAVNKVFHSTWVPASGVTPNTLYTVVAEITYGGTTYNGVQTIQVGQLGEIKQGLTDLDTAVTSIDANVDATNEIITPSDTLQVGLKQKISEHAASQAAYRAQTQVKLNTIKTQIGSILEDTSNTIPDLITLTVANELAKGIVSEIVTTQAEIKSGQTLPFRFRTESGLTPRVTVVDPDNNTKVDGEPMQEFGGTGIYTYKINFKTLWGLGRFRIHVEEPTSGAADDIVLKVVEKTKEEEKTASPVSTSAVSLDTLYSRVTKIDSTVTALSSGVNTVKANSSTVSTDISDLLESITRRTGGASAAEDAAEFGKYINSVSSIIGSSAGTTDMRTIMGKLNGIESTLGSMGIEASAANDFNVSAKEKAARIKRFVTLIMTELRENGEVTDPEEKSEILDEYLTDLKQTVEEIPNNVTTEGITDSVSNTLQELDQITIGKEGLEGLAPMVKEELGTEVVETKAAESLTPEDMQDMRNDVSGLKSLMLEIRGLLDEEVNAPVVHGWLEGI